MYNTNWKIITCAILLSHVSSFASNKTSNNFMSTESNTIKHSYVQINNNTKKSLKNNNIQQEQDSEIEEE